MGFTVRFLCCGWLCVWGCFTWNVCGDVRVVLKNEGMVFDHVTSPLPVVVGVGVFSCLMFHVKLFH